MAQRSAAAAVVLALLVAAGLEVGSSVLTGGYRTDPPSITNPGMGGYTVLYSLLASEGYTIARVEPGEALQERVLGSPTASALVVASPDKPLNRYTVETILSWAERGGLVIILDETGTTAPLLKRVNITLHGREGLPPFDTASCRLGDRSYTLLLDVYTTMEPGGSEILCTTRRVGGSAAVVAVAKHVGNGTIVFIGDSTILANLVYHGADEYFPVHLAFFKDLIGERRHVVFLEDFLHERIPVPLQLVVTLPGGVLRAIAHALIEAFPPLYRSTALLITIIALLALLGVTPSMPQRRRRMMLRDLLGGWQRARRKR